MAEKTPPSPLRRRAPTAVGEAVQGYLARAGLASRIAQAQVVQDWATLVGPQIAAVATPESMAADGTLFVRVTTSSWMTELQLMGPEIMARVNAGRGEGKGPARIRTIRWLLAR